MDTAEARGILTAELERWKQRGYADLRRMVEARAIETAEVSGPSGTQYQLEIQAVWDDPSRTVIRVIGSIDDSGWRAWVPLSSSFFAEPEGAPGAGL
jgi:hypothetical protein